MQYHQIFRNDACPLFCVYTLFQLWYCMTDFDDKGERRDLYLFPPKKALAKMNFSYFMPYKEFRDHFMDAIKRAGFEELVDICTSSLRKTAWMVHIAKSRGLVGEKQQCRVSD
jgi:hypothetical protein